VDGGPDAGPADAGVPVPDAGSDGGLTAKRGDGFGILLLDGSSARVTSTFVERSAVTGIYVIESSIQLESSAVIQSGYIGVAIADCLDANQPGACKTVPGSEVHRSSLARNQGVGLLAKGVDLVAKDNDIGHTKPNFNFARNVQLKGNATVLLERNRIHHSDLEGIVVDGCAGTLADNTIGENQERGLWLQHISQAGLKLNANTITKNGWVGIGATQSVGVTVKGGLVSETKRAAPAAEAPDARGKGVGSARVTGRYRFAARIVLMPRNIGNGSPSSAPSLTSRGVKTKAV
jgi:hypothetical protein